ncbi:hypothetical protein KY284_014398 [Solanum tuberosum]|nr:hypothetical protein KY284_014398 [Solanum tuberosum]
MLEGTVEYLSQIISAIVSVPDNRARKHPRDGDAIQANSFVGKAPTLAIWMMTSRDKDYRYMEISELLNEQRWQTPVIRTIPIEEEADM